MTTATTNSTVPLSSPAADSRSSDMPLLTAIVALVTLIAIPTLIYAFFFAIKCPPNPFERLGRRSGGNAGELTPRGSHMNKTDWASVVKYIKEDHGKENGGECPVCLSAFVEGEEIRQLNACKHSFHFACIDMWLYSHSSCPVCRASIAVKRSKPPAMDGEEDFRQGLPDSDRLV
ncbi:unnamed protein product [Ilex paraguariensis]|uniref:RING-type domain-containing protein n=1 Tax=Ilex paraguariensis TaxID=185542 RepID=A0ABC8U7K7_9AQUA